ncbi:uncharacterized protein LOC127104013 [Lathyrus oleraceus]|uniref:uncharacterized protein LOC127104013 n=1 Tax=Pisum sativum TaxID=3888 RepID=UPI0021D1AA8A|nr:uncharacterized protein LOC127104013 [Pisum sativum]
MSQKIKYEVQKQFDACFLVVTSYPIWVANIVHVPKKDAKMDLIKYIYENPAFTGKVSRWQMFLTEYGIHYTTQKANKSSIVVDYLAHQPIEDYQSMKFEFPDEDVLFAKDYYNIPNSDKCQEPGSRWTLMFDGASNSLGNGVGVVITSATSFHIPITTIIYFDCTNNIS